MEGRGGGHRHAATAGETGDDGYHEGHEGSELGFEGVRRPVFGMRSAPTSTLVLRHASVGRPGKTGLIPAEPRSSGAVAPTAFRMRACRGVARRSHPAATEDNVLLAIRGPGFSMRLASLLSMTMRRFLTRRCQNISRGRTTSTGLKSSLLRILGICAVCVNEASKWTSS